MKKKLLSTLMVFCLLFCLILTDFKISAEYNPWFDDLENVSTFSELKAAISKEISKTTYIVVTKDIEVTEPITIEQGREIVIMSEGNKSLMATKSMNCMFSIRGNLTVTSNITITVKDQTNNSQLFDKAAVYVRDGGVFEMRENSIISCCDSPLEKGGAGAVYIDTLGHFIMDGSTARITFCEGDPASVYNNGNFYLENGMIYVDAYKTAVTNSDTGTFYANGGTVKNNKANSLCLINAGKVCATAGKSGTEFTGAVTNIGTVEAGKFLSSPSGIYKVSFDTNGGTPSSIDAQYRANAPATEPTAPTKTGYTFDGWYNGDAKYDFKGNVTKNMTLKAKWVISDYTAKDEEGFLWALENKAKKITLGSDITLTKDIDLPKGETTLDLNGYVISGTSVWNFLGVDLYLCDSRPTATHSDSSLPVGGVINSGIYMEMTSEKPEWLLSRLYANGGTVLGNIELKSLNQNKIRNTTETTTVFRGQVKAFSTISGGIYYKMLDISGLHGSERVTKGIFYGGISREDAIDSNATKFTVAFNSDGGTEIPTQIFLGVTSGKALEPTAPTKSGYKFVYWSNNNAEFDFNTTVSSNTELAAVWRKPGDVSGDDNVSIIDLVRLKKGASSSITLNKAETVAADMDGNGSVNAQDLTMLIKQLLGVG